VIDVPPPYAGSLGALELIKGNLDFVTVSRELKPSDVSGFHDKFGYDPFSLPISGGTYRHFGFLDSIVFFVHRDNPLRQLTFAQLDAVLSKTHHRGGAAITTWGQLGLTGEWADKPIHVYGFNLRYNTSSTFSDRVLFGSDKWNEDLVATGNYALPNGKRVSGGDFIARAVADDPYAIAYTNYSEEYKQPGDKPLDLAEKTGGPYVKLSIENSRTRAYPMVNFNAFFMNETPGTPMNPLVKEFLRFILSREGQAEVQHDGKHLPLTAEIIARERAKLEQGWGSEP
jgi:phosphate transport system substrate-binding protein